MDNFIQFLRDSDDKDIYIYIYMGCLAQWNERGFLKQHTRVQFRPRVVQYNWAATIYIPLMH